MMSLLFRAGCRPVLSVILAFNLAAIPAESASPQSEGIRINVLHGEGLSLVVGSGTNTVQVEVLDSANKPVSNASVSFIFGSGGRTTDDLTSSVITTDPQGRASVPVRPTGQLGAWSIRVTASVGSSRATATITLNNVAESAAAPVPKPASTPAPAPGDPPAAVAPAGSATPATPVTTPKKNHTALIIVIVAVAVGGGVGAALAAKGKTCTDGCSCTNSCMGPPFYITISLGAGGFTGPTGAH